MLTSLIFTLSSAESSAKRPVKLPPYLGRASHAIFLNLIAEEDPGLAERLHAPNQLRPYTCSRIWGAPIKDSSLILRPDNTLNMRYTGLTAEVSAHLQRLAEQPPASINVEGAELSVVQATLDPEADPWAGQTTYEALSEAYLLAGRSPSHRARIWFASPTGFRSGGMTVPVPLPDLVYGSLVETWNAFSPVAISDEARRFAEECLGISRYQLSTRAVSGKGGAVQIGFVGKCQYTALNRDRYWLGVIQLLTDFAFYAGIGYQTAAGMGQARRA